MGPAHSFYGYFVDARGESSAMTDAQLSESPSTGLSLTLLPATLAIFLISVCGLFLEMLLIRWIGTEVRIFAYLQNSILIACFLGLGLGSLTSRKPVVLWQTLIPLAFLLVCLAIPFTRKWMGLTSEFLGVLQDFVFWGGVVSPDVQTTILALTLGLGITFVILRLTVDMFVPIGRLLGRLIDAHPNTIWAYSVNVAGSLAGIWLFVLLSRMYQPPVVWVAIFAALFVPLIYATSRERGLSLLLLASSIGCAALAGWTPGAREVVWSPYQKLGIEEESGRPPGSSYQVTVNNVFFQSMVDPGQRRLDEEPAPFPELNELTQYDIPLLLHPHPRRYLVVGAGTGNDAAAGVRHGVPEITAVEIDPAIIDLGRRYHPEHPYDSSSVQVVNDDARSFFSRTRGEYDVIVFGALDSHTTTAMTNARLDHYVYTKESIARARALLAEGGVLVVSFAAQRPFIVDRMAAVLREEFQQEPLIFGMPHTSHWSGLVFVTGNLEIARKQIAKNTQLRGLIEKMQQTYPVSLSRTTQVATDDWPYIYLQEPRIPMLYYLLAGLIVLVAARSYSGWNASGTFSRWQRSHWHFFFLGAGFLLLEVQNISKASVVLGNTWQVNAVVVSGVLLMILLANLLQRLFPSAPIRLVYVALIASCVALYFIDLARFAFLPYTMKAILVGGLTTLPMVFSGIIFVRSLTAAEGKDEALGANLLGALVGGLLQTLTFLTGIRALLLVVAAFYFCSLVTRPKDLTGLRLPETGKTT